MAVDNARLMQVCEKALEAVGYELVELEYLRDQGGWVLRVFIDHPVGADAADGAPGGDAAAKLPASSIRLQDCEEASRHLGTVLDIEDVIPTAYRLEVSSPGVRRPLRKERDFKRFIGNTVRVQLREAHQGRKNFVGCLCEAGEGQVGVEMDGQVFRLPLDGIRRARLEVEL